MSGGAVTYYCVVCHKVVSDGSQGLECPVCCNWQHRWHPETGVSRSDYYAAGRGESVPAVDTWKCKNCSESNQNKVETLKICVVCEKIVTDGSQGLECPVCCRWQHRRHPETRVSRNDYYAAGRGDNVPSVDTWKCKNCSESNQNEGESSKSCIVCKKVVTDGSQGLKCTVCCGWQHRWHPDTGVSRNDYFAAERGDSVPAVDSWKCKECLESNQNEGETSKNCIVCRKVVTDGSQGLKCTVCCSWQHRWHSDSGVSRSDFDAAERGESVPAVDTWKCRKCLESNQNEDETSKICIVCRKVVTGGSQGLKCTVCCSWQHQWHTDSRVSRSDFDAAERGESVPAVDTWKCIKCLESNQNESETSKICIVCRKVVTDGSQGLECPVCCRWQHRRHPETGVSRSDYYAAGRGSSVPAVDTWKCKDCLESNPNNGEISKTIKAEKTNGQFHNSRAQENHKETGAAFNTNSITKKVDNNSLNHLIPEETIYHKMKNFLKGTADAKIVNTELSNWILDPSRSAEEILQLVSKEFQNIPGASSKRDHRAWLVFMVIHNLNRIPGLVIEGTWLDVILCLINYTHDFDFQSAISFFTKSESTRNQTMQTHSSCFNWVIQVLSSKSLCISPYLQLELIRHIYNKKYFTSLQIQGIMQGVINIMSDLDPEHLFTVLGENFHCTPEHILFTLHFPGIKENEIDRQRNILGNKVQRDLKLGRYTKEIAFVDNTIKYAGLYAQVTAKKYSNDTGNLIKYLHQCLSLFMFGSFNPSEFGKLYQSSAYKNPLLLPSTYDGIADITEAIIGVPMTFMSNKDVIDDDEVLKYIKTKYSYKRHFNKLMKRRNNLIRALDLPCATSALPRMFALREINGGHKFSNRKFRKEIYKHKYMEYKI